MAYFVIHVFRSGVLIEQMSKEKLVKHIEGTVIENGEEWRGTQKYFESIPKDSSPTSWGRGDLIIKGEIVVPKPKEVITKYEIE